MGKRIVLRTTQVNPVRPAGPEAFEPFEPGKERRHHARRGGLPRRMQPDRRGPNRLTNVPGEKRGGLRRDSPDRRRHRDRRFGLDPTLYDRLADLDL